MLIFDKSKKTVVGENTGLAAYAGVESVEKLQKIEENLSSAGASPNTIKLKGSLYQRGDTFASAYNQSDAGDLPCSSRDASPTSRLIQPKLIEQDELNSEEFIDEIQSQQINLQRQLITTVQSQKLIFQPRHRMYRVIDMKKDELGNEPISQTKSTISRTASRGQLAHIMRHKKSIINQVPRLPLETEPSIQDVDGEPFQNPSFFKPSHIKQTGERQRDLEQAYLEDLRTKYPGMPPYSRLSCHQSKQTKASAASISIETAEKPQRQKTRQPRTAKNNLVRDPALAWMFDESRFSTHKTLYNEEIKQEKVDRGEVMTKFV